MRVLPALLLGVSLLTAIPAAAGTLYEDLGGQPVIERITSGMVDRVSTDPRTAAQFDNVEFGRLKKLLAQYFCMVTDGPCTYTGRDMHTAHRGLKVNTAEFNALVENLQFAMDDAGIPFWTQNRLLARLASFHREVITR